MIKEHGDLFSDSQCKVCSAVLISESQKLTHYQVSESATAVSVSGDLFLTVLLYSVIEREAAHVLPRGHDYLMCSILH